jgi:hypothetical protein
MQLLVSLFPSHRKLFEDVPFVDYETHSDTVRRRGIGCEAGYDAYFTLYPSPNEVPKRVIDLFMGNLDDNAFLVEFIESYIEKKDRNKLTMVGRLFGELLIRFQGQERPAPTQALLDALFYVGENIIGTDWPEGAFRASPLSSWEGLVSQVLLAWGEKEPGPHLEESFRSAKSTAVCASLFVHRARELQKMPDDSGDQPTITDQALGALGAILLQKIERDAADGTLGDAPLISGIALAWKYLGGASEAKAWLNENMSASADFMSRVTEGFVSYTIGSEPRRYRMTERPDPELYDLVTILDAAKKHLKGNELTDDARNRVGVVATMAERQLVIDREEQVGKNEAS